MHDLTTTLMSRACDCFIDDSISGLSTVGRLQLQQRFERDGGMKIDITSHYLLIDTDMQD